MANKIDVSRIKNRQRVEEARMSGILNDLIYDNVKPVKDVELDKRMKETLSRDPSGEFPLLEFSFGGGADCQRCGIETYFFIWFFAMEEGNCARLCSDCAHPYMKFQKKN